MTGFFASRRSEESSSWPREPSKGGTNERCTAHLEELGTICGTPDNPRDHFIRFRRQLAPELTFRRRDVSLANFLGKEKLDRPTFAYCKTGGTLICVHGGDSSHHPPSTMEDSQSAIARGVRCIEADVTLTNDGHLMVLHKRELVAMTKTGGTLPNNFTMQLIFDITSIENGHIPTLVEIVEQFLSQADLMILDVTINYLHGAADNAGQTNRCLDSE